MEKEVELEVFKTDAFSLVGFQVRSSLSYVEYRIALITSRAQKRVEFSYIPGLV